MNRTIQFLVLFGFLFAMAWLVLAPANGTGWVPSFTNQLGVELDNEPEPDENFTTLAGVIKDAEKLRALGFADARNGVRFTITHKGNVDWTAVVKGKEIHPCIVQVHVLDLMRILEPEKATLKLNPKR